MLTAAHGNNWLEFTQKAVKEALKMMKMIILGGKIQVVLTRGHAPEFSAKVGHTVLGKWLCRRAKSLKAAATRAL
jgi:hypothetical protein